jgi:uncharacterized glyoxalase superfamily protein PhnB
MPTEPPIIPGLFYDDPTVALDWLAKAFGFELRMSYAGEDGKVAYAELALAGGVVAVRPSRGHSPDDRSPRSAGGLNTQHVQVIVGDVDAHCARARAAGARIVEPLEDKFYGFRNYTADDCEGHRWTFESPLPA